MKKSAKPVVANDELAQILTADDYVQIVATPRTLVKPAANYTPSLPKIFSHIRPDGLEYRKIPSLMGSTRKLITGEVVE